MSIRKRLVLLVLAVSVPAALASWWSVRAVYHEHRGALEQGVRETTRALALVVDGEIERRATLVRTLSESPTLTHGDLRGFHEYARRVAPGWESVVVLSDLSHRQILNTRRPLGEPLPASDVFRELRERYGRTATVLSDLYHAPVGDRYSFAIQAPVIRDGEVRYYVSLGSFASQMQDVLTRQDLPANWRASIVDRRGIVVARKDDPDRWVGKPVSAAMQQALGERREGSFDSVALDGTPVVAFYSRAPDSDWAFIVAVPRADFAQASLRRANLVGVLALVLLAIGTLTALWISRGIERPVRALAAAARALGEGRSFQAPASGLAEADLVGAELERAGRRIHDANRVLEQRVVDALRESEQARRALLQSQKLEALGRLSGGIAHDFNNLLQSMVIGLRLADSLSTDARVKHALESCGRAVGRATRLTRQLLTFGQNRTGDATVVDLRASAAPVHELLRSALRADVELRLEVADDVARIRVDATQLELALLNLALNARDAMPDGGRLTISASNRRLADGEVQQLAAGDWVAIEVRDDGAGIPPDVLPRVFEPFFTTKDVGAGSGLGLAQVYGFARQSGGGVTIDSRVGAGTVVTLLLPAVESTAVPEAASAEPPVPAGAPTSARVLVVEDDALVRGVVAPALRESGFEVLEAADAAQALRTLAAHPGIDVVFSDIAMPGGMDGAALTRRIRAEFPQVPVVLATGYAAPLPPDLEVPVLQKPYTPEAAVAALRRQIERRARADADADAD